MLMLTSMLINYLLNIKCLQEKLKSNKVKQSNTKHNIKKLQKAVYQLKKDLKIKTIAVI